MSEAANAPAPPPDLALPLPFTIDTLTEGERQTIEASGGNPDAFVGCRVPINQVTPSHEQQAVMAIAPFSRAILRQPKILIGAPQPVLVGPSHIRLLLPRNALGDTVQTPPAGRLFHGVAVDVEGLTDEALHGLTRAGFAPGNPWHVIYGTTLEGHIDAEDAQRFEAPAQWLSEAEPWAHAYELLATLNASAIKVRGVRITHEPR